MQHGLRIKTKKCNLIIQIYFVKIPIDTVFYILDKILNDKFLVWIFILKL